MASDGTISLKRASAALTAASLFGSLTACGNDNDQAVDTTTGKAAATVANGATSAVFKDVRDNEAIVTSEYVAAVGDTGIYAAFGITRTPDGKTVGGIAYFCDGKKVANWFPLRSADNALTFTATNGATFDAEVDGTTIKASVTLSGTTYEVTALQVDADGEAGLYLADHVIDADLADNQRAGWIVLPDGTQRGAIRGGTTILPGPSVTPANPNVNVAGREVLLRAITHIICLHGF